MFGESGVKWMHGSAKRHCAGAGAGGDRLLPDDPDGPRVRTGGGGRILTLYHRLSALHQFHYQLRHLYF
jgi:hypothetical protein